MQIRKLSRYSWSYNMANVSLVLILTILIVAVLIEFNQIKAKRKHQSYSKFSQKSRNQRRKLCDTESCDEAGYGLFRSINFSVNPCDDFYEYACGNWDKINPIPVDESMINSFGKLDKVLTNQLKEILEQQTDKKTSDSRSNKNQNAQSVQFAYDLYQECMDRDSIKKLDFQPIKQYLKQILGKWPVMKPSHFLQRPNAKNFYINYVNCTSKFSYGPIFSISIVQDANQTTTKRIHLNKVSLGMGRKEYNDTKAYERKVKAYKQYMTQTIKLFVGSNTKNSQIDKLIDQLFQFETKLALASTPQEEQRYASSWYNRMTLGELQNLTSKNWTTVVNRIVTAIGANISALTDKDLVIVYDIAYLKNASQLIRETPQYIINNYIGWEMVSSFADYGPNRLFDVAFEYKKVATGVQEKSPLWQRCVKNVNNLMDWAISRLYVDRFVNKQTKQIVTKLIQHLRHSFHKVIQEADWLDQKTRKRTVDKLNAINSNVAYPDWIHNNTRLDKYFGIVGNTTIAVEKGKYFQSLHEISLVEQKWTWSQLNEPVDKETNWPMPPAIVNAAYLSTQNSMTIPAGILYPPFFDAGRPMSMNFGSIGAVIGHEISHGFDDQGRQFDKHGNLVEWWTKATKQSFNASSKCFVDQYGAIKDKDVQKNLNGINTLGENIADNGGLHAAYLAYRNYIDNRSGPEPMLPHMAKFTPDQLFFLSYANIWCGNARPEIQALLIDYNEHAPNRYRVNIPLGNFFDKFSQAFHCPANSPMNIKKRCKVW